MLSASQTMFSVYRPVEQCAAATGEKNGTADGNAPLLYGVRKLCHDWLADVAVDELTRQSVLHLEALTENLINTNTTSEIAMSNVRALLCFSCRNLHDVHPQCTGQPLRLCPQLQGANG